METLGQIRHGNIVKLLFSCNEGRESRILGYEYMENDSLSDVLHGEKSACPLDWPKRFKIVMSARPMGWRTFTKTARRLFFEPGIGELNLGTQIYLETGLNTMQ